MDTNLENKTKEIKEVDTNLETKAKDIKEIGVNEEEKTKDENIDIVKGVKINTKPIKSQ